MPDYGRPLEFGVSVERQTGLLAREVVPDVREIVTHARGAALHS